MQVLHLSFWRPVITYMILRVDVGHGYTYIVSWLFVTLYDLVFLRLFFKHSPTEISVDSLLYHIAKVLHAEDFMLLVTEITKTS